ncbi:DGQHR domain-containing protein [Candidatus Nitrospira allomarina]|uniref:DGQHR domain-containing protein n=1 Tax=Candidatus Nitrospira allomarina TaxID=3020900 RepID=A0AA96GEY8_9BACT|nr:DGQHR domain-containing protein [Candidatus Nitrospira allomarina]WNM56516.1 DGQHR domain-containing protein [Candidatus Nitrospira allomarina]
MSREKKSFGSVSLVRQGGHKFYSLTIPSDVIAQTTFVINREEDPIEGFQRELDKKRAAEIAVYIDSGLGTVPSSIVLSAQADAALEYNSSKKSLSFNPIPKAFLIIDGQHRVYGFKLAKTALRIPVIIYDGLTKRDESRLFIDINSTQKGVRPELLLDIKKLAEYESDEEQYLRDLFDIFNKDNKSVLLGRLSAAKKRKGHYTRNTFNSAFKPLIKNFGGRPVEEVYEIFNNYLYAFREAVLRPKKLTDYLFSLNVFKSACSFFPTIAERVKDKCGAIYSVDNFKDILEPLENRIKANKITETGNAYKPLLEHLEESLKKDFTL